MADLGTAEGRAEAVAGVDRLVDAVDGLVTWAGVAGLTTRPGSEVVSVNYFGTIAVLEGLRPLLARGERPAAVAIASNSTTAQPGVPMHLVEACLDGDEEAARAAADAAGGLGSYPASKLAISRWCRRRPSPPSGPAPASPSTSSPPAPSRPRCCSRPATTRRSAGSSTTSRSRSVAPGARRGRGVRRFLLGPDARFFCGSVLFVDGGTDALLRPDATPAPWEPAR